MSKQNIYPVLRYADVRGAVEWLGRVFSFEKEMAVDTPDGNFMFATMKYDGGTIMLSSAPAEDLQLTSPKSLGYTTAAVHVYVQDLDEHFQKAKSEGANIVRPLAESDHGTRDYSARDLEGQAWTFSNYQP